MVETKSGGALRREAPPMGERGLEQHTSPLDIGLDEISRTVDRSVDMGFRREVQNGVGVELAQQRVYRLPIADIGLAKRITGARFDRPERAQIGRIGELVDIQDRCVQFADEQPTNRRADKAGTTRYQSVHRQPTCLRRRLLVMSSEVPTSVGSAYAAGDKSVAVPGNAARVAETLISLIGFLDI